MPVFILHCDNPSCGKSGLLPVALELEASEAVNFFDGERELTRNYEYTKRLLFHNLACLDGWRAAVGEGTL